MSHLNPSDNYSDGYVGYQEEQIFEKIKTFPAYKFLEYLWESELFWTPDNSHYFLLQEMWDENPLDKFRMASACVNFGPSFNTWIEYPTWKKYCVHIDWLCSHDDWRGTGTLGTVSKLLQIAAEETGVFLFGHARPFKISLPRLINHEEVDEWIKKPAGNNLNPSLAKDKKAAKKLYQKYLEYGFCNYDGVGITFNNRWWRNTCFGYRSSKIESDVINDFLDRHLFC